MTRASACLIVFMFFTLNRLALAQEKNAEVEQGVLASYEAGWRQLDLKNNIMVAVGNVQLQWRSGSLRCDNAVIWLANLNDKNSARDKPKNSISIKEIYAEGEVHLRHHENWYVLESARGFVDPINDRGVFFDTTMSVTTAGKNADIKITGRAQEALQIAANRFELHDVTMTTSPFSKPGYHISTKSLKLQIDPPAQDPQGPPGKTARNIRYEIDGSIFHLGGLPILPVPSLSGNTQDDSFHWFKGITVDNSNKFGPSVEVSVGTPIEIDGRRWGDWTLYTRYLGDRGPGVGLDLEYQDKNYRGRFEGFYQNDSGQDELFGTPPNNNRGRATWQHRHQLPEKIQLDLEFSKLSDRGFLPEYYESEFKEGKEQETLAYLKRSNENRAATLLASARLNDFQDQVEHQPQFGYNLISEPLFDIGDATVYFDADYEISRARRRFDDATNVKDVDSFRTDLDNRLSLPFFVGPVKLEPFAGFRHTYYSNSLVGEDQIHRVAVLYGIKATTQLSRAFNVVGGLFDLDGLRHIVTPEIEYLNAAYVSRDRGDIIQFDRVDAVSEFEVIKVGVRNRLQTLWDIEDEAKVVDFVDLDIEWSYFPHSGRDGLGKHAGNLDVDLILRTSPTFTFLLDFEYSFVLDDVEVLNATFGWLASDELTLAFGYRRFVDVNDAVFVQAQWQPNDRLGIRSFIGYDFEEQEFQDAKLIFVRHGADWVFEMELSWDNSNDFGFGISVTPKALFDPRLRARSLRHEPRFYQFGRSVIR